MLTDIILPKLLKLGIVFEEGQTDSYNALQIRLELLMHDFSELFIMIHII